MIFGARNPSVQVLIQVYNFLGFNSQGCDDSIAFLPKSNQGEHIGRILIVVLVKIQNPGLIWISGVPRIIEINIGNH